MPCNHGCGNRSLNAESMEPDIPGRTPAGSSNCGSNPHGSNNCGQQQPRQQQPWLLAQDTRPHPERILSDPRAWMSLNVKAKRPGSRRVPCLRAAGGEFRATGSGNRFEPGSQATGPGQQVRAREPGNRSQATGARQQDPGNRTQATGSSPGPRQQDPDNRPGHCAKIQGVVFKSVFIFTIPYVTSGRRGGR